MRYAPVVDALVAILSIALAQQAKPDPDAVILQRQVIRDGLQRQMTEPPRLPSDADLARIEVAPELVRLARALDGEHHSERAAAREAIVARRPAPDELMALLLRTDLGLESRNALVGILRDRILTAPRGALGIRMEGLPDPKGGVRISGLVPGMPAERVLKVDDVIEKVNADDLSTQADLIRSVQSLPPGAEVSLTVRRPRRDEAGKPVLDAAGEPAFERSEVRVRLGSTEDLVQQDVQQVANAAAVNMVNAVTIERQILAAEAVKRFLPPPRKVDFPDRARAAAAAKPAPTVDALRKLLMEYQLGGGDADLVQGFRLRLDAIAARLAEGQKKGIREELEALETELRGAIE